MKRTLKNIQKMNIHIGSLSMEKQNIMLHVLNVKIQFKLEVYTKTMVTHMELMQGKILMD